MKFVKTLLLLFCLGAWFLPAPARAECDICNWRALFESSPKPKVKKSSNKGPRRLFTTKTPLKTFPTTPIPLACKT